MEVPRISATAASTVQTQVHKLVAEGHVVAEMDTTTGTEVTYRQQGNLDHYTELVDLWTETVDPEDYISLLYCITHCLTYLLDDTHKLKPLEGQYQMLLRCGFYLTTPSKSFW
eukprot:jgi/Phyca11/18004/fgenesh1_pg.PHYCAscaffold_32_\